MLYINDLSTLLSQWTARMQNPTYPQPYRDAIFECCYELNNLIQNTINEELSAHEYFDSVEADSYLSTLEAHVA